MARAAARCIAIRSFLASCASFLAFGADEIRTVTLVWEPASFTVLGALKWNELLERKLIGLAEITDRKFWLDFGGATTALAAATDVPHPI